MESRMEKYYKDDLTDLKRTKKNEKLYKDISEEISDLDNLPVPDNSDVIDIDGLKKIISSRSEYQKARELEKTFVSEESLVTEKEDKKETKVYDINVLLENAKREVDRKNEVQDKRIRSNFLANLEDANIPNNDDALELATPEVEKKEESSGNTDSLPLEILMDLKGSDNTVVTDPIVKDEVTMIKKVKDGETFYSGSYTFSKKDFASEEDDDDFLVEKSHNGLKIFFLILGLLILAGAVYLIVTKYVL